LKRSLIYGAIEVVIATLLAFTAMGIFFPALPEDNPLRLLIAVNLVGIGVSRIWNYGEELRFIKLAAWSPVVFFLSVAAVVFLYSLLSFEHAPIAQLRFAIESAFEYVILVGWMYLLTPWNLIPGALFVIVYVYGVRYILRYFKLAAA